MGLKYQNGQFKGFELINFRGHKKKVSKIYLVSWGFISALKLIN